MHRPKLRSRHRTVWSVISPLLPKNKKAPVPPYREQGQAINSCGTTLFAGKPGRLITVPTHRLPDNGGKPSRILGKRRSPRPQRSICRAAFRPGLSNPGLSVDALTALLPPHWFDHVWLFLIKLQVCLFVKNFFLCMEDKTRIFLRRSRQLSYSPTALLVSMVAIIFTMEGLPIAVSFSPRISTRFWLGSEAIQVGSWPLLLGLPQRTKLHR